MAQIAVSSAETARNVAGIDPRVAILSFSTKGSAKHETVDRVIEATKIAQDMAPELAIDGELQADLTIVPSVAHSKAPNSEIAGTANVLVFPNLNVGNITYKLVQRISGTQAVGPILQGLAKPVNDLSAEVATLKTFIKQLLLLVTKALTPNRHENFSFKLWQFFCQI